MLDGGGGLPTPPRLRPNPGRAGWRPPRSRYDEGMEFVVGGPARRLALLAGAWNPPTRAHLALALASLAHAGGCALVLPRVFPHKTVPEAEWRARLGWISALARTDPRLAAAVSEGGLFVEMAREARSCGAEQVFLVCGKDAAERIVGWDYGAGPAIDEQLAEFEMLVAARGGQYSPPARLRQRVRPLEIGADWQAVSSSEVRRRAECGGDWRALVPDLIAEDLARWIDKNR